LRTGRQSLGIRVMLTFTAVMDARVGVWEETMFLLARYTVAAAVFLSASAASAVEDAILSADQMLPACTAFIADNAPSDIDGVFQAGRCIGTYARAWISVAALWRLSTRRGDIGSKSACGRYIRRGASRADARRFSSPRGRGHAEGLAVQVTEGGRSRPTGLSRRGWRSGGDTLAGERVVNICRAYSGTGDYWALVPGRAKSAATIICMGASKIIMAAPLSLPG